MITLLILSRYILFPHKIAEDPIRLVKWFQRQNKLTNRYFKINPRKIWK